MNFKEMTLLQLKAYAKEKGIRGVSTLKKNQLIERIIASENKSIQTKAGEGFALDEAATRPRIITFSYKDSHTPVIYRDESYLLLAEKKTVELPEKERPSVPQPAPASNPKTGDVARPEALAFLGLCSLAIIIRRRKNR